MKTYQPILLVVLMLWFQSCTTPPVINDIFADQKQFVGMEDKKDSDFFSDLDSLLAEGHGSVTSDVRGYIKKNLFWGKVPVLTRPTGEILAFSDESILGKNIKTQISLDEESWDRILVKSGRITQIRVMYNGKKYDCNLDVSYLESYDYFVIGVSLSPSRN